MKSTRPLATLTLCAAALLAAGAARAAPTHTVLGEVLAEYTKQIKAGADPVKGEPLLVELEKGATPLTHDMVTPVDHTELEAWFETNCQRVLQRSCTVNEKADVTIAWMAHVLAADR